MFFTHCLLCAEWSRILWPSCHGLSHSLIKTVHAIFVILWIESKLERKFWFCVNFVLKTAWRYGLCVVCVGFLLSFFFLNKAWWLLSRSAHEGSSSGENSLQDRHWCGIFIMVTILFSSCWSEFSASWWSLNEELQPLCGLVDFISFHILPMNEYIPKSSFVSGCLLFRPVYFQSGKTLFCKTFYPLTVKRSSFWKAKWSQRALWWNEVHWIGTCASHPSHHVTADAAGRTLWFSIRKADAVFIDTEIWRC